MGLLEIQLRNEARKTKNFALADAIRNGLTDVGISLGDPPGWKRCDRAQRRTESRPKGSSTSHSLDDLHRTPAFS